MGACAGSPYVAGDARVWSLHDEGPEARLAYGTPNSDDAPLLLSCAPRSGRVTISKDAARPGAGVTLASNGTTLTLHGEETPDMLNGQGVIVTAQTPSDTPVLRRFRDTGRIALEDAGRREDLPAAPAERAQIRRFFDTCGRA
jgi:hypothetical protein